MEQHNKTAEILNDLVLINNDRIEGYSKAIEELKGDDKDLKSIFEDMKQESAQNKTELADMIQNMGHEKSEGTRMDGKIYRAWMDVKATFSGNDRKTVLESCEFGEDAAQKAYKSAISSNGDLTADARDLVSKQQAMLKASHDKIKQLRDSMK